MYSMVTAYSLLVPSPYEEDAHNYRDQAYDAESNAETDRSSSPYGKSSIIQN